MFKGVHYAILSNCYEKMHYLLTYIFEFIGGFTEKPFCEFSSHDISKWHFCDYSAATLVEL